MGRGEVVPNLAIAPRLITMPQRRRPTLQMMVENAQAQANQRNGLVYVWAFSIREQVVSPAFTKRQQLLSPDQYEIVDVRTLRGVRRAMLFAKAVLQAEFEANAPLRETMAIKRKQLRAKRPAK